MASRSEDILRETLRGSLLAGTVATLVLRILVPGLAAAAQAPSVNALIDGLPLLLGILWLLVSILTPEAGLPRWRGALPATLFLAWGALSVSLAGCRVAAIETWTGWAGVLLLGYLVHSQVRDPRSRRGILAAFVILGAVVACLGIQDALGGKAMARELAAENPDLIRIPDELKDEFHDRLQNPEVSGPFILSNLLAGYLILLIPLTAGLVADTWPLRGSRPHRIRLAALISFLILEVLCITQTGSKGGWIALGGGIVAFAIAWRPPRSPGIRKGLIVVGLALAILLGTGMVTGIPGESMKIRDEHFRATRAMIEDHPVTGVGPGNFSHHYPAYRLETAEETKFAHNNYLQVAAETGIPGIAFLLLFFFVVVKGMGRASGEEATRIGWGRVMAVLLGGAGGILAVSFFGPFGLGGGDAVLQVFILAIWAIFAGIYFVPEILGKPAALSGRGILAGTIAAAVAAGLHGSVDLDLYSPGILCATIVLLVLAGREARPDLGVAYGARVIISFIAILAAIAYFALYFPAMANRDAYFLRAEDLFWEASDMAGAQRLETLRSAEILYREASVEKPWDFLAPLQGGRVLLQIHEIRKRRDVLEEALWALERARERAPHAAEIPFEMASATYSMAAYDHLVTDRFEAYLRDAVRLYPTRASYRYHLARLLYETRFKSGGDVGALEDARAEAGRALELSERTRLDRLRLSDEERKYLEGVLGTSTK